MKLNAILLALGSTSLALAASVVPRQSISVSVEEINAAISRLQQAQTDMNNQVRSAVSSVESVATGFSAASSSGIRQGISSLDDSLSGANRAIGQLVDTLSQAVQGFQQADQGASGLFGR